MLVGWVLRQLLAEAERIARDPAVIRDELARLEAELSAGRISEEEFDQREDELLDRMEETRRYTDGTH
ncbi:gas vesicle protein GvpG [Streptomyces sp. L500]